ncbi:MAG: ABC transporter permease [Phycisphaerales bacterium]|nr:ABC transporter permease [Phycisphaerales bacterium]
MLPFDYAVRNLGRSAARLLLSVLGSALVVVLVIAAAAFVRGMSGSLNISGSANNIILLGAGSEESVERSEVEASTPGLLEASVSGVRARAGVSYVSPQVHVMLPVQTSSQQTKERQALIRGVTPEALLVHDMVRITEGRLPRPGSDEIMLGRMVGTSLGVPESDLAVGGTIVIDGRPWKVCGRFAAPGTVMEGEVWAPLLDVMAATKRATISCVVLTIDPALTDVGEIEVFTKMRPDLELVAMTELAYYGRLAGFFGPIKVVAWVTAALIALGGLFGGLNTMYAAFASRVRELGALQSLGFRRAAIVVSLVQESLLATTVGGLLACAVAVLFLDGLAVRFSMGAFGLVVDAPVVGVGLCAGLGLGLFGALPPAVRCLRLSIPEALKSF